MPTTDNGRSELQGLRIGINAHLLSSTAGYRRAGIHQYIAQVLRFLPALAADTEYLIYARHMATDQTLYRRGFTIMDTRWPTEQRLARIFWEQTAWPLDVTRQRLDLLHSMAFVTPLLNRVPEVLTIYDLSFFHFPQLFPTMQRAYLQSQTARSVRGARRLITISEASKMDICELFGVPPSRVDVVYPGVDPFYVPAPKEQIEQFRHREQLPEKMLLHVGTLQPRKNIPVLLHALAQLQKPEVLLVMAGGKGWMYDELFALVDELGLREQVRFAGYVPDEDLPLWYNAAAALVFPSMYEGFGMPVIEAMACGTPVIAARSSSIPEAGGGAALYFEPEDVDALTLHLAAILEDERLTDDLRGQGQVQAAQFTWPRAGRETADVYRKALLR